MDSEISIKKLIKNKTFKESEKVLKELLQNTEKKSEIYEALGIIYLNENKYNESIENFQKIIQMNIENQTIYYNIGLAYYNKKEYIKALEMFQKYIEKNGENDHVLNNIGIIKMEQGKWKEAEKIFKKGIEISSEENKALLFNLSRLYYEKGKFLESLEVIEKISLSKSYNNDVINILIHRAILYEKNGEQEKAFLEYQKLLKEDPQNLTILNNLGIIEAKKNHYTEALQYFLSAMEINPDDIETLINVGYVNEIIGNDDQSIEYYSKAVEKNPMDLNVWFQLIAVYDKKEEIKNIQKCYESMLKIFPTDFDVLTQAGMFYLNIDQEKSEVYLSKSIEIQPKIPDAYFYLGILYHQKADDCKVLEMKKEYAVKAAEYYDYAIEIHKDEEFVQKKQELIDQYRQFFN